MDTAELPATTELVRFGDDSCGKWHIVHLPRAQGPYRNQRDVVAVCGRTPNGGATTYLRGDPSPSAICQDVSKCRPLRG